MLSEEELEAQIKKAIIRVLAAADSPLNLVGVVTNTKLAISDYDQTFADTDHIVYGLLKLIDEGVVSRTGAQPQVRRGLYGYELSPIQRLAGL